MDRGSWSLRLGIVLVSRSQRGVCSWCLGMGEGSPRGGAWGRDRLLGKGWRGMPWVQHSSSRGPGSTRSGLGSRWDTAWGKRRCRWGNQWASRWDTRWDNEWANRWANRWGNKWANRWGNKWANRWVNSWGDKWANRWVNSWGNMWGTHWANKLGKRWGSKSGPKLK